MHDIADGDITLLVFRRDLSLPRRDDQNLIAIVNVKAFGWRLPFHVFPEQLIGLVAVALLASLLAALLPVVRLARMQPASLVKVFANDL